MGVRRGERGSFPLDFGNSLLNIVIILVLRTNGYETIKVTVNILKDIKILTLLAVLFLFSAPSLMPLPSISNSAPP